MDRVADGFLFDKLEDLEAPTSDALSRGIKLSSLTAKLQSSVDITPLLGKFQQLGFVKIVYNPSIDEEPLIQLTEQGLRQARELLFSLRGQVRQ